MVSEPGVSSGKDLQGEEDPRSKEDLRSEEDPRSEEDLRSEEDPEADPVLVWVPSGRRLISGLLGLNVVLLGAALVAGQALNPEGLKHQEPLMFILILMGASVAWMLWYLLWARWKHGRSPHRDHHAGGATVTVVLMLFAGLTLLVHVFKMGYSVLMKDCSPAAEVIFPFIKALFLGLQTYFLWAHSKDCIHKHKIITRSGLMVTLSADLLLWLRAISEDAVHQEIELEKEDDDDPFTNASYGIPRSSDRLPDQGKGVINATVCKCITSTVCLVFRKGYEVFYPFEIEYYLMTGCMIYVMWKNVGRSTGPHPSHCQTLTLRIFREGGIWFGPLLGFLVLITGVTSFILYQVWVGQRQHRTSAFLVFYAYHLALMPVMSICCLAGMLVHKLERKATEGGHNPTRSLDALLLLVTALGQLGLSYFCLVAALALGPSGVLGSLDLAYSLLSLLELLLQNIFIIKGLHRHPSLVLPKSKERNRSSIFKLKRKTNDEMSEVSPSAEKQAAEGKVPWTKRAMQEICAFLILSNIMLWIIPAFGVNPQFENGLGKKFFGFTAWFLLVNLGQPLGVFYRMHSVGALVELLITA